MSLEKLIILNILIFLSGCGSYSPKSFFGQSFNDIVKVERNEKIEAEIIGFDSRKCGCCWGWRIQINEIGYMTNTLPDWKHPTNDNGTYLFPVKVKLNYEKVENSCRNRIIVNSIELI